MGESDVFVWVKGGGRRNDAPSIGDLSRINRKRVKRDIYMAVMWRERKDAMLNRFEGIVVLVEASVDLKGWDVGGGQFQGTVN